MYFSQGHAIVIGVGTHKNEPDFNVPITVSDAEAVKRILTDPKKCGYPVEQVALLTEAEATKSGILRALDELIGKVNEDDTVLIFYAGHGALGTDNQYYLVSHDAQFEVGDAGKILVKPGTGVSQIELLDKLRAIKAKRALLIFNACYSGSLQPQSLGLRRATKQLCTLSLPEPTAAALLSAGEGRIIISACRPDQRSKFRMDEKLTFFTRALTDGLRGKAAPINGFISAFSLYTYVYDMVMNKARKYKFAQEPMITVLQGVGPFVVALHSDKTAVLGSSVVDTLPKGKGVREVTKCESQEWMTKIENQTIVKGDYVAGDKVGRDKIITQINFQSYNLYEMPEPKIGIFDHYFLTAYWTPVFLVSCLCILSVIWIFDWNNIPQYINNFFLVILLIVVTLVANIFQFFADNVVKAFSGDWGPDFLRAPWLKGQKRNLEMMLSEIENLRISDSKSLILFREYPFLEGSLKPTRLGNVLESTNEYSKMRYGMDNAYWWPRLLPLLPDNVKKEITQSLSTLMALLNLSCLSIILLGALSFLSFVYLLVLYFEIIIYTDYGKSYYIIGMGKSLVVLLLGIALLLGSYRGAVSLAIGYCDKVRVAIDMYRFRILRELAEEPPKTPHEETELWQKLTYSHIW
jgi:hypothetical protein